MIAGVGINKCVVEDSGGDICGEMVGSGAGKDLQLNWESADLRHHPVSGVLVAPQTKPQI